MADETKIQVLKETERRAQSQSCMWLVKFGENGLLSIILFGYTETRVKYHIVEQRKEYRCKRFKPVIDGFFDWLEK